MSHLKDVPFDATLLVRDRCLCLHLQRAARHVARIFDDALRPLGLTNGQFSLLMSLNRPHPPAMKEVSSLLAMDRTTLTAALKPLERRAWVAVDQDPLDKRTRLLSLTSAGKRLLAEAFPVWQQTQGAIERQFSTGETEQLLRQLRELS